MKRCKVGMLAYISNSAFISNVGAVIEIVDVSYVLDCDWIGVAKHRALLGAMGSGPAPIYIVKPGEGMNYADSDLTPILPPDHQDIETSDLERILHV